MLPRWITTAYLVYLAVPIVLLFAGSFGDLWLNTLLPTGNTTRWYEQVASDASFRRAFAASLVVATLTCVAAP
jgi:putative spermidine/putrescine transport system permease protein